MQPRRLPDLASWWLVLERVATARFGPSGARPGQDLAAEIRAVSETYTRGRDALQDAGTSPAALRARMRFFLPRDLPKALGPLDELARADALPTDTTWRVLDLGAGLGTTSFGAAFAAGPGRRLEVDAVDRDRAALDAFVALAAAVSQQPELELASMEVRPHVADFLRPPPSPPYDLILAGLALNEGVRDVSALLDGWMSCLAPGGSVVVLEPALREPTRALMALRDAAVDAGFTVFAPCTHAGPCPMRESPRDWCHEDFDLELPGALGELARAAGLRTRRLTYAALTLRVDGRTLASSFHSDASRIVSAPLVSKGKRELVVCDARGLRKLRRLDRERSDANAAWSELSRGDLAHVGDVPRDRIGRDHAVTAPGTPREPA